MGMAAQRESSQLQSMHYISVLRMLEMKARCVGIEK